MYRFFTSKEIKPAGWLRQQLEIQAAGLAGNLDKVWPDVRDSAWIGGTREGWERVPYWLDGFIPLAYLLGDEDMIARAKRYIDAILAAQQADGWICPNGDTPRAEYDSWAVQLLSKVLVVWYDCSGDERIPAALYRVLKNYYDLLSSGDIRLFGWGKARWFETFIALNRLTELYPGEAWMAELAHLLRTQGTDWPVLAPLWQEPKKQWTFETHIVNIAMMLKFEAVSHRLLDEPYEDRAEALWQLLERCNGTPVGIFTGDEVLAGCSPIQGSELCSVVELMYSLECLYAETGDRKWAERLERVAFNALPATVSEDMWTHQYDQLSNQIDATPFDGAPVFTTNNRESHIFGLEPNFGCCTANMGQGWPKLCLTAFLASEKGIVCATPVPSKLETEWNGARICLECDTDYPFRNEITFRVSADRPTDMELTFFVPSFAEEGKLNGAPLGTESSVTLRGFSEGTSEYTFAFTAVPRLVPSTAPLYFAECGSLVFALPIREQWSPVEYEAYGVERKFPYCDYRVTGESAWNYALADEGLALSYHDGGDVPFSAASPRVTLTAHLVPIDWGTEPGYPKLAAKKPHSTEPIGPVEETGLIPYGCAKLRITEMPKSNHFKEAQSHA